MCYYVYILRCKEGTLYTGITTDLARRLAEHRGGRGAKYTRSHPVSGLEAAWQAADRAQASRLEYRIKTFPREKKERLVRGEAGQWPELEGCTRLPEAVVAALNSDGPGPERPINL